MKRSDIRSHRPPLYGGGAGVGVRAGRRDRQTMQMFCRIVTLFSATAGPGRAGGEYVLTPVSRGLSVPVRSRPWPGAIGGSAVESVGSARALHSGVALMASSERSVVVFEFV